MHTIGEFVSASTSSCAVRSIDENGNDLTLATFAPRASSRGAKTGRSLRAKTLPVTASPRGSTSSSKRCQTARIGLRSTWSVVSVLARNWSLVSALGSGRRPPRIEHQHTSGRTLTPLDSSRSRQRPRPCRSFGKDVPAVQKGGHDHIDDAPEPYRRQTPPRARPAFVERGSSRAPDGDEVEDDFRTFVQGGPSRSHIGAGYCRTVGVRDGSFVGLGRWAPSTWSIGAPEVVPKAAQSAP